MRSSRTGSGVTWSSTSKPVASARFFRSTRLRGSDVAIRRRLPESANGNARNRRRSFAGRHSTISGSDATSVARETPGRPYACERAAVRTSSVTAPVERRALSIVPPYVFCQVEARLSRRTVRSPASARTSPTPIGTAIVVLGTPAGTGPRKKAARCPENDFERRLSLPAGDENCRSGRRKLLAPAPVDERRGGRIDLHDLRHPGLRSGIEDDRRRERHVVSNHLAPAVHVRGGLETREDVPEERPLVLRGFRRVVGEDDERPSGDRGIPGEVVGKRAVGPERRAVHDERAGAEDRGRARAVGQRAAELVREVADRLPEAEEHALAPFVHLRARVVERVHREVAEQEEIRLEPATREDVLEEAAEVAQVPLHVGDEEELRESELALAEDAERRRHRLAAVPVPHDSRRQRVEARVPVAPEVDDGRHHERK